MRTTLVVISAIVLGLVLPACGGGSSEVDAGSDAGEMPCDLTDNPCPEGQRCTQQQTCVDADPLQIVTESLPSGRVNFGYDARVQAEGGLEPYRWEIAEAAAGLEFLSISSSGRLTGTPDQVVQDATIRIAVIDSGYGGGERSERQFTISVILCNDGDRELCYGPSEGVCYQGIRICEGGQMGACTIGSTPSTDPLQCGADCSPCDNAVADACTEGLCTCGTGPVCEGGLRCCEGECIDVSSDVENCGSCFHDCHLAIAHAEQAVVSCEQGSCDYTGPCDHGWLDCDTRRNNGCERPVDVHNCGECALDCDQLVSHVSSSQRQCQDLGDAFVCDYTGTCNQDFDDCDSNRSNGCETYLNETDHCGSCSNDCGDSQAGGLCLSPDPTNLYFHECGCRFDTASGEAVGCPAGDICCRREDCQDCTRWCTDPASDSINCGVCDAECGAGESCSLGACTCGQTGTCPASSGATSCQSGQCVCAESGAGDAPCQPGWFCCDGTQGGTGGSEQGDPDIGCCRKLCGQNEWESFPCVL
ncbi:MAG: hypothetical protein JXR96_00875 [Deltaproteobacteria bacterium]|nr:hypothetical protein [Deltaproteobacteria bacterium]